ncbi:MAG: DMT family transporter, partial [Desulfovibrionaceae bacterium]|nr:DMT family transporter [Desulfovibrionaceae bacterium]
VCFGLYSLFMRERPRAVSPLTFNAVAFGLGLLYSLPFTVAEACVLPLPELSGPVVTGILYAGVGCSSLAFWLWTGAIDRIGAVNAGFVYYGMPVFAAAGSVLVLGESISAAQITGGLLVMGGILLATVRLAPATQQNSRGRA